MEQHYCAGFCHGVGDEHGRFYRSCREKVHNGMFMFCLFLTQFIRIFLLLISYFPSLSMAHAIQQQTLHWLDPESTHPHAIKEVLLVETRQSETIAEIKELVVMKMTALGLFGYEYEQLHPGPKMNAKQMRLLLDIPGKGRTVLDNDKTPEDYEIGEGIPVLVRTPTYYA